ncbi:MAG: hypothetical protein RI883_798 [Bacteroidota bacterium]|jgi:hypothetical protein
MNREERSVTLAILTLVVYAGFLFYDTGAILFPFPLNELIFLLVTLQFSFWNWKTNRTLLLILLIAGVLNFISTQFFWTFLLRNEQMELLVSGITLDLLKISYYLFLLIGLSYYFLTSEEKSRYIYLSITLAPILITIATSNILFETISFLSIAFIGYKKRINSPIHLLWLLIGILQIMKIGTLYF